MEQLLSILLVTLLAVTLSKTVVSAGPDPVEQQLALQPETTAVLPCGPARRWPAVKSAKYGVFRGDVGHPAGRTQQTVSGDSPNCNRDYTKPIKGYCQGRIPCEVSTLSQDLPNPCPGVNGLRFTVIYTCERGLLESLVSDDDPMCGFAPFSRYCN